MGQNDATRPLVLPTIGHYQIIEEIGEGGMGKVYKAHHTGLGTIVAVKIMAKSEKTSERERSRFVAEAQIAARLRHPNIVTVHDIGTHEGKDYIVMDYIDGDSLAKLLKNTRFPVRRTLDIMKEIALAVDYVHQHNIIHRDLKPENVMIERSTGKPLVMDFGLAKNLRLTRDLTKAGELMGTPKYMAPEQAYGKVRLLGPVSDVYSLGAIFYEMLTGVSAIDGSSSLNILFNIANAEIVAPRQRNQRISQDIETVCLKAMEKNPRRRYQTAGELAAEIDHLLKGEPILARPRGIVTRAGSKMWRHKWQLAMCLLTIVSLAWGASLQYREYRRNTDQARNPEQQRSLDKEKTNKSARPPATENTSEQFCQQGQQLYRLGKWEEAIAAYNKALAINPKLAEAHYQNGLIREQMEDYRQAVEDFGKAIELDPQFVQAYYLRAAVKTRLQDGNGAFADLNAAIRLQPRFIHAYYQRATMMLSRNELQSALADYNTVLGLSPGFATAYFQRGETKKRLGDLDGAIADYGKTIDLDPRHAEAFYHRCDARKNKGDVEGATEDYCQGMEIEGANFQESNQCALMAKFRMELEIEMENFTKSLEINPKNATAYHHRGLGYLIFRNLEAAIEDFSHALRINPDMAGAYKFRGWAFAQKMMPQQAVADLNKYLELQPQAPDASEIKDYIQRQGK